MANPEKLGELSAFYYVSNFTEVDTEATDAEILTEVNETWVLLCIVDANITRARAVTAIIDRCVGEENEYTGGKRDTSLAINMNEFRLSDAMIKNWHTFSDTTQKVGILVLDDLIDSTTTRGIVGNFIVEQDDDTQPQEGPNTNALTFRPTANSAFSPVVRRIYGSAVT